MRNPSGIHRTVGSLVCKSKQSGNVYIRHVMTHEEYSRGLEKAMRNSVLEVDPKRHGRLLARNLPAVIRTEEENERLIAALQTLCFQ